MLKNIFNQNPIVESKIKEYNTISVAFVGDAVYSLFIRTYITTHHTSKSGELHKLTSNIVKADSQSKVFDKLQRDLNEKELDFAKTTRNTHTKNIARGSTIENYKKSSELEGVLGYNYLLGNNERLLELLNKCLEYYLTLD